MDPGVEKHMGEEGGMMVEYVHQKAGVSFP